MQSCIFCTGSALAQDFAFVFLSFMSLAAAWGAIFTSAVCSAISLCPSTASGSSAGIDAPSWTQAPSFLNVWQACEQSHFSPLQSAAHCRAPAAASSLPWGSEGALQTLNPNLYTMCLQGVNVPDDLAGQSARPSTAPGCSSAPPPRQLQTHTTAVQTEAPRPRQRPARRARSLQVRGAAPLRGAVRCGVSLQLLQCWVRTQIQQALQRVCGLLC